MRKYDNYKDSGIEWIGQVPKHWNLSKVKFLFDTQKGKTPKKLLEKFEEDTLVYLAMDYLRGEPKQIFYVSSEENVVLTDEGETLLLWDGSNAGEFLKSKKGVLSSTMALIKSQIVNNQFQWYSFKSFESILKDSCNGMGIPHVDGKFLRGSIFLLPPFDEQTTIANYLDQKTTQIDDLIAKKERLIQLLQEERIAIINQAVTKGLDPAVPMKDSGIDWLGEIPEHWEVKKIGHVSKVVRGASPRPAGDPLLFNGDFLPWITVKEVTNAIGKFIISTESFLTEEGSKQTRIIEPETLLLSNSGATLGVPRITKIRGGINDGSVAFFNLKIEKDFLYYFFTTHIKIFRDEASGYGQPNLNTDIVKSTKIPIPNETEQIKIVQFIEDEILRIESIISKSHQEIELLKEYKTALISEVVTGKVDVRNEKLK